MLRRFPISGRTPLKQSKPLRRRRKYVPVAERRHMARVAEMGCLVCGGPSTIHHVTSDGHQRLTRSNRRVVPLCPPHHQIIFDPEISNPVSVERLTHAGFREKYGIDLLFAAEQLWSESE